MNEETATFASECNLVPTRKSFNSTGIRNNKNRMTYKKFNDDNIYVVKMVSPICGRIFKSFSKQF